jgi:hypothetical protein
MMLRCSGASINQPRASDARSACRGDKGRRQNGGCGATKTCVLRGIANIGTAPPFACPRMLSRAGTGKLFSRLLPEICLFRRFCRIVSCASVDKMAEPFRMVHLRSRTIPHLQWRDGHE